MQEVSLTGGLGQLFPAPQPPTEAADGKTTRRLLALPRGAGDQVRSPLRRSRPRLKARRRIQSALTPNRRIRCHRRETALTRQTGHTGEIYTPAPATAWVTVLPRPRHDRPSRNHSFWRRSPLPPSHQLGSETVLAHLTLDRIEGWTASSRTTVKRATSGTVDAQSGASRLRTENMVTLRSPSRL